MCKLIAELVGADKHIVSEMFSRLENSCGQPGVDVRLMGDIYGQINMKMRALGLDPKDTTPSELYQALLNLAEQHDGFLAKRLGLNPDSTSDEISQTVVNLVNQMKLPKQVWALKHTSIRRLLKSTPPKTLMKKLNYRSLDSLLKREPASLLLVAARHSEPMTWQNNLLRSYKKLTSNDFEMRETEITYLADERWQGLGKAFTQERRNNIIQAPEAGAIAVLPIPATSLPGLTLVSLLLILHHISEIRAFSTFCKFHNMHANFGNLLTQQLLNQNQNYVSIAGQALHWRVIHRYYGQLERANHPEIFQPHVQPEDLAYRKAEQVLYHLEPALHFWHDSDYIGLTRKDGPISFSLTDNAMNLVNRLPFEKRAYYHMQESLWGEIYGRYLAQPSHQKQILLQLDEYEQLSRQPVLDSEFAW